jgi:hypothetical protein
VAEIWGAVVSSNVGKKLPPFVGKETLRKEVIFKTALPIYLALR